ncbi:hypothetical protein [Paenibacillus kandeliae]|uniref:hypothetical protein n=1 Tax=Paenibacillus kandeliae TaxID=3231269 RepID=UPI00345879EE
MIRKWYTKPIILMFMLALLTATSFSNQSASAAEASNNEREKFNSVSQDSIEQVLNDLTSIPDEILNTNDADTINNYLISVNSPIRVTDSTNGSAPIEGSGSISTNGAWDCGLAIAGVLVTTAVPVTKIVKITKLVKSLGGATEAAKIIWGASFTSEKWAALGGVAKDLVAELAGITAVKKACGL